MGIELIIIIGVIVVGFIILGIWMNVLLRKLQKPSGTDELISQLFQEITSQNQLQHVERGKQTEFVTQRLETAAQMIARVQRDIGEFSEVSKSMKDLYEFMRAPKLRGGIGEEILNDLLLQIFPKQHIQFQYGFSHGQRVDAVIKTDAGLLPIDAKFPLENFRKKISAQEEVVRIQAEREFIRDISKHLETIKQKYILPNENTVDFALMYIPSEAVFYDVVQNEQLMDLAKKLRVYPVSPTTLYAHLQTILLSFAGKQFATQAKEIFAQLRGLHHDFEKMSDNFGVLQKHITNAYNQVAQLHPNVNAFGQKLKSTTELELKTLEQLNS